MLARGERGILLAFQPTGHRFPSSATSRGQDHFENFTSVNSLTLMDVYEEDTLGDTSLQIWKVRYVELMERRVESKIAMGELALQKQECFQAYT